MQNIQTTNLLSVQEMESINGGTADPKPVYDLGYFIGAAVRSIIEFNIMAMQYQQSLPANLKK